MQPSPPHHAEASSDDCVGSLHGVRYEIYRDQGPRAPERGLGGRGEVSFSRAAREAEGEVAPVKVVESFTLENHRIIER